MDLLFTRFKRPEVAGFNDTWMAEDGEHMLGSGPCRTSPNHRQTWADGGGYWNLSYGLIATGEYKYRCLKHDKFGKCLIINEGEEIPSEVPNPKHGGKKIIAETFVHRAVDASWPGSAGCFTVQPSWWDAFIGQFHINDMGKLTLIARGEGRPPQQIIV